MKEKIFYSALVLAILILISGCGSGTGTPGETEIAGAQAGADREGLSSSPSIPDKTDGFQSSEGFGVISVNITADRSTLPFYRGSLVVTCDDFSIIRTEKDGDPFLWPQARLLQTFVDCRGERRKILFRRSQFP